VDNPFNNNVTYLVSLLEVGGLLQSCARVLVIFLLVCRLTDLLIGVKEDHLLKLIGDKTSPDVDDFLRILGLCRQLSLWNEKKF